MKSIDVADRITALVCWLIMAIIILAIKAYRNKYICMAVGAPFVLLLAIVYALWHNVPKVLVALKDLLGNAIGLLVAFCIFIAMFPFEIRRI